MLFKKKSKPNTVPGEKSNCLQCKHYMLGNFCQQSGRQKAISFDVPWGYWCSYFQLDNSRIEETHKQHSNVSQCLKNTVKDFNAVFNNKEDESDNVIPIAGVQ